MSCRKSSICRLLSLFFCLPPLTPSYVKSCRSFDGKRVELLNLLASSLFSCHISFSFNPDFNRDKTQISV